MAPLWRDTAEQRMLGRGGDLATQIGTMLEQLGVSVPPERLAERTSANFHTLFRP
jgi:hypothetical protein